MYFHKTLTSSATQKSVLEAALAHAKSGYSVIPIWGSSQPDYFKVAAIKWSPYQKRVPRLDELHHWFKFGKHHGIAIVTGRISALAVLDFDDESKFRIFSEQFPHLTKTYIVKTPRGWHLYFQIPTNCTTKTRQSEGIDWQWEGRYVVAPPTQGYCPQNDQNPRLLSQNDITAIENYLDAYTPVFTRYEPITTEQAITATELQGYYSKYATNGNRNNTLFQTGLMARDYGWSLKQTIDLLASAHVRNGYDSEPNNTRHREAIATIKSAFSRPARKLEGIYQLTNSIREELLRLKLTCVIRLIDGLRIVGYQSGQWVTWQQAWEALKGIIGRDSIINAFHAISEQGKRIFQQSTDYMCPSPEPPSHANAAKHSSKQTDHKMHMVTLSKSGKSQLMGRPTDYFQLPSNIQLARVLGVSLSHITDVLSLEDLKSAKATRMALHYRFIERRPGKYSTQWLAQRLGVSKITKNRYDRALPNLHKRATYSIKYIYWHNLDEVPDEPEVYWQFLEDEQGNRYPAKKVIAIKLLKQKHTVRLMRRGFNYYWIGHRFEVDTSQLITVIKNNHKLPEPNFSGYWKDFYHSQEAASYQDKPKWVKSDDLGQIGDVSTRSTDNQEKSQIPHNGYSVHEPFNHNPKQPFTNEYLDHIAKGIQHTLNQMSNDTSKHISLISARQLVAKYGWYTCKQQLKYLKQKPQWDIDRPVGLYISMLRSNKKRSELQELAKSS